MADDAIAAHAKQAAVAAGSALVFMVLAAVLWALLPTTRLVVVVLAAVIVALHLGQVVSQTWKDPENHRLAPQVEQTGGPKEGAPP